MADDQRKLGENKCHGDDQQLDENNCHDDRDWSLLPIDIAAKIGELLPLPHRIYFRMVCKSWCDSVPPVNIPSSWLLLRGDGPDWGEYIDYFAFCFVPTETIFKCPVPPRVRGMNCVESNDGWLVMSSLTYDLSVLNPLTKARIDLPSFLTHPCYEPVYAEDGSSILLGYHYTKLLHHGTIQFNRRDCLLTKVVISSNPTPTNFAAVAIHVSARLTYTRVGDSKWHVLNDNHSGDADEYIPNDVVFYDGRFWALVDDKKILAFDLSGKTLPKVWEVYEGFSDDIAENGDPSMPPHLIMYATERYLAITNDGHPIFVLKFGTQKCSNGKLTNTTQNVILVQLRGSKPNLDLHIVKNLESQSLFVGYGNNFFAEELPQLKGNLVFLTDLWYDRGKVFYDVGFFDMGKQSFQMIYPYNSDLKYWLNPPPVWFKPSLT